MAYADLTTCDPNIIKRWLHFQRFRDAVSVLPAAPSTTPLRVLDYGAGDGELARHLSSISHANSEVWLYEPTPQLMAEARSNLADVGNTVFVESLHEVRSAQFDLIYCLEVFEHLPDRETEVALDEICRLLKPGGTAVIGVPHELYLPALLKGIFRMMRRFGRFDATPRHILAATVGAPPTQRPTRDIAPGFAYHFHHLGFDFRRLERRFKPRFAGQRRWFSPFRWLGIVLNSEVYYALRRPNDMNCRAA